ncbi:MAG TPA: ribbon-helix-helix protein, CopG family [Gemmatimonadales bacterium]|nr:ribbon-helix-helix protein, CopG family [Gemmatimonadales bacterium]
MKDAHLTVRLPAPLARALARRARETDLPRSHLVREAVVGYLAGPQSVAERRECTAAELAMHWRAMPHLTVDEAAAFAEELNAARTLAPPSIAWD